VKRLAFAFIGAVALGVSGVGTAAAAPVPPAQAGCAAHVIHGGLGAPGLSVAEFDNGRQFGSVVSKVARAPGSTFEECLAALVDANE